VAAPSCAGHHIVAWHHALVSNGPTEALNNLINRIERIGFGFRRLAPLPDPGAAMRREPNPMSP
jgi:hypothetical protein